MVPGDAVVLASHDSPTLAEVIRQINKRSNNVMARTLLLTLGAERGRKPATVASSEAVKSLLARQGLDMPELVIDNGAGLSREARVSADSLASMLTVAWNSPVMPEYISSLAIAGVDGTVPPPQGRRHAGHGSPEDRLLRDVRSIAGYVLGASGKRTCWSAWSTTSRQARCARRRAHRLAGRTIGHGPCRVPPGRSFSPWAVRR